MFGGHTTVLIVASKEESREAAFIVADELRNNGYAVTFCNACEESNIKGDFQLDNGMSPSTYKGIAFLDDGGDMDASVELAKKASKDKVVLGGFAEGAVVLGEAGVLKGQYAPAAVAIEYDGKSVESPAIRSGDVITSLGSCPQGFAFLLVDALGGKVKNIVTSDLSSSTLVISKEPWTTYWPLLPAFNANGSSIVVAQWEQINIDAGTMSGILLSDPDSDVKCVSGGLPKRFWLQQDIPGSDVARLEQAGCSGTSESKSVMALEDAKEVMEALASVFPQPCPVPTSHMSPEEAMSSSHDILSKNGRRLARIMGKGEYAIVCRGSDNTMCSAREVAEILSSDSMARATSQTANIGGKEVEFCCFMAKCAAGRGIVPRDVPQVQYMHVGTEEDEGRANDPAAEQEALELAKDSGIQILRDKHLSMLAVAPDGAVVGALWTSEGGYGDTYSFDVVVHPRWRRIGIGSRLAQEGKAMFDPEAWPGGMKLDAISDGGAGLARGLGLELQHEEGGHSIYAGAAHTIQHDTMPWSSPYWKLMGQVAVVGGESYCVRQASAMSLGSPDAAENVSKIAMMACEVVDRIAPGTRDVAVFVAVGNEGPLVRVEPTPKYAMFSSVKDMSRVAIMMGIEVPSEEQGISSEDVADLVAPSMPGNDAVLGVVLEREMAREHIWPQPSGLIAVDFPGGVRRVPLEEAIDLARKWAIRKLEKETACDGCSPGEALRTHVASLRARHRYMLLVLYARSKWGKKTSTAGLYGTSIAGPYANLDLPWHERIMEWKDADDWLTDRDKAIHKQPRYNPEYERTSDNDEFGIYYRWAEPRRYPYYWSRRLTDGVYPSRELLINNPRGN